MSTQVWNPNIDPYEPILSDYLSPIQYPHNIKIDLVIEVYRITYDWGLMAGSGLQEYVPPYYEGNLKGQVTSANFVVDSTSDIRTTGSFSIILDKNSKFNAHANDCLYWQYVWFKVIKQYIYQNDGGGTDEFVVGWFVPDSASYDYNAESGEFSISCTDMISFYTETRGGHLSEFMESCSGLLYQIPSTANPDSQEFIDDMTNAAMYASGMVIEGEKNNSLKDKKNNNYLDSTNEKDVGVLWRQQYTNYKKDHSDDSNKDRDNFKSNSKPEFTDTASLVRHIIGDYAQIIPLESLYIRLQNDYEMLPYDMEFDGNTSLYDVLKKIIDLYPRQHIFFDTNRRLNLIQSALAWGEVWDITYNKSREFYAPVLEERWNISTSNLYNFTFVWGRDQTCHSYYYISDFQAICENCGKLYEYPVMPQGKNSRVCKECGGDLQRVYVTNSGYSIQQIGTHKQVVYNDNITNEIDKDEAFNAAKALTLESCHAKKTLSVTLEDRYFNMYSRPDIGVGTRIEYTSKTTRETDLYTIIKWSNNFLDRTVTLELEPFYPCIDEHALFMSEFPQKYSCKILPTPEFEYTVDDTGLLTMIIHNGWHTKYSMFKIYYTKTEIPFGQDMDFWSWSISMHFLGETCEVYSDETDTQHQTKVFRYQFKKSGKYIITCQAWNPNIHPSSCPDMKVVDVNIKTSENKYVSDNGEYYIDKNGDYYTV